MPTFLLLLSVFAGGAAPWLEAIIVIPAGIVGGLHPVAAVAAGATGNLLTVWLAAYAGDRIRTWWKTRRAAKGSKRGAVSTSTSVASGTVTSSTADVVAEVESVTADDTETPTVAPGTADDTETPTVVPGTANDTETPVDSEQPAKNSRARRILERWGLPMLAAVGPLGLGTQLSALVAVSFGISAARAFRWIATATVLWSIAAAWLTVAGLEFAGFAGS